METETRDYLATVYATCQHWLQDYYMKVVAGDELTEDDLGMKKMVVAYMFLYREHFDIDERIFDHEQPKEE